MKNRSVEDLRKLSGIEFNAILAADPILKSLQDHKNDDTASLLLCDVLALNPVRMLGSMPLRPLTAAKWAFLRTIRNAFTVSGPCEDAAAAADVFLFVCSHNLSECEIDAEKLRELARDCVPATGLTLDEVCTEILEMIRQSFAPLGMLVQTETGTPMEPWEWLANLCGIVARETCTPVHEIMHGMPLSAVCAHYVNYRRRECGDNTIPLSSTDYQNKIDTRIEELAEEFLHGNSLQDHA